jgi:general stress protein YciG
MPNQGGSRDQHDKAGRQSHKKDDMKRGQQGGQQGGMERSGQQRAEEFGNKQQGGQRGGSGNFANDPQRASEAGRKGGQS